MGQHPDSSGLGVPWGERSSLPARCVALLSTVCRAGSWLGAEPLSDRTGLTIGQRRFTCPLSGLTAMSALVTGAALTRMCNNRSPQLSSSRQP